jgi:hypothetical protein
MARGELSTDTDARITARGIVASLQGLSLLTKVHNDPKIIEELGRHMLAQMLAPSPATR